jgi:hypothetical protein
MVGSRLGMLAFETLIGWRNNLVITDAERDPDALLFGVPRD